ncbi:hypothetical protein ABTK29_18670, partial [Acinetobacter baumannii]
ATERLADWLGLPSVPRFVTDLGAVEAGLTPGDLENLQNDIIAAQKSGRPFTRSVRPQGSARSLTIKGQRAPRDAQAPGGIVLWV